jgi:pimeloyl-ACP methyl ester carboxylesterase
MINWSKGDVALSEVTLHYYRSGGDKPALVLAHGVTDDGLCWSPLAQALIGDYDVIAYDARGHGLSSRVPAYHWDDLAHDAAGLIQALHLARPRLMGHSLGAATAAALAAYYPDLPGCVVLEDPPWNTTALPDAAQRRERYETSREGLRERQQQSREALMALCRVQSPAWSEAEIGPWADAKLRVDPEVAQFFGEPPPDFRELVPRIACPILLVTADPARGAIVTADTARAAAALWRRGEIAHVAGAGHCIHREQYDAVVSAVTAFLARNEVA